MKKVVVLGAGLVAGPHIRYLLEQGFQVTVADQVQSKAAALVGGHPQGKAIAFDLDRDGEPALDALIAQHDLAVSLLPYSYHVRVAESCLRGRKHMVTTSYARDEMRALDGEARRLGLSLLNEVGVDPGIDHMTAMKVIHRVQNSGGEIRGFSSYCGGLPAPEANTNPFGYKFSWSPRGVLLAGRNAARFLRDGKLVEIPGAELFLHHEPVSVEVEGKRLTFEGYPNRDSLAYAETYGITSTRTMFRGTLRYPGWCATCKKIVDLGLLDDTERPGLAGMTCAQFIAQLPGRPDASTRDRLGWLGLLDNEPLPEGANSPLDILTAVMLKKMQYGPGERDMLIMQHRFEAIYNGRSESSGRAERITSTLVDFGVPGGDSSMSRTVGLPSAVGVRMILEGKIRETGVLVPVIPGIYEPILEELDRLGIRFLEETEAV